MEKKIRLGFIGAGGQQQLARLDRFEQLLDECELTAIADIKPEQCRLVAQKYRIAECYTSTEALLENADVDAYVVTQMYNRQHAILPQVIAKGKPILSEKPVAYSVEAAEKLAEVAKKYDTKVMIGYQMRSDEGSTYVRDTIRKWKAENLHGGLNYMRLTGTWGNSYGGADRNKIITSEIPSKSANVPTELTDKNLQASVFKVGKDKYNWAVNSVTHVINLAEYYMDEPLKLLYAGRDGFFMVFEGVNTGTQCVVEAQPYLQSDRNCLGEETIFFDTARIDVKRGPQLGRNTRSDVTLSIEDGEVHRYSPVFSFDDPMQAQAKNFLRVCRSEMEPPCNIHQAVETMRLCKEFIRGAYNLDPLFDNV